MKASLEMLDFEPLTTVKAKLSEMVGRVVETHRLLAITLKGKPTVVMVSYDEFLKWMQQDQEEGRTLDLVDWEKESKQRRAVVRSIKNMFDVSTLNRKGQKPYKKDAIRKFGKT